MTALAESLVDEWLNRQGFFSVRGIKHGVDEIDLLGVRPDGKGLEAWHVEVQASFRPIGYISPLKDEFVPIFAKNKKTEKNRGQTTFITYRKWWSVPYLLPNPGYLRPLTGQCIIEI